jgi:hypothetical protein
MLYAAMRDTLVKIDADVAAEFRRDFLYTKPRWADSEQSRLSLSSEDDGFFRNHVLAEPGAKHRTEAEPTKSSPDSHWRIKEVFGVMQKRIKALVDAAKANPADLLKELDQYMTKSAKVLVLTVPDDANAFQIFEALNARGADLEIADLLKNYILGRVEKAKRPEAKHHWDTALGRITAEGGDAVVKKFIHHFWASKKGLIRERELYDSLRASIKTSRAALEFGIELAASATNYAAILNSDHDFWTPLRDEGRKFVSTLRFLKMEQYKPLLLACMDVFPQDSGDELRKVLQLLVSSTVRFRITNQLGSSKLEQFYQNAGRLVREKKIKIAADVRELMLSQVPNNKAFELEFATFSEKSQKLARYYLHSLEKTVRNQRRTSALETDKDSKINTLEHILPKDSKHADWSSFDHELAAIYKDRLGNQTLLLRGENVKLGNRPYAEKFPTYIASEVELTKRLREFPDWTPQTIQNRQTWMASLAVKTWQL